MKFWKILTLTASATFLAACGGGGGGEGAPVSAGPVISTDTFQIKAAFVNYFNDSRSLPFTINGTSSGYSVTGSGTLTQSSVTSGTFEGAAVLQKASSFTGSFVLNGATYKIGSTDTAYVDSNYVPKGWTGGEYAVITSATAIPVTGKINDTGVWHTANRFTTSAKTTFIGTSQVSFSVQPDTASTALLKIIQIDKDSLGNTTVTSTINFRMTPAGVLTRLSETGFDSTANLTLTY